MEYLADPDSLQKGFAWLALYLFCLLFSTHHSNNCNCHNCRCRYRYHDHKRATMTTTMTPIATATITTTTPHHQCKTMTMTIITISLIPIFLVCKKIMCLTLSVTGGRCGAFGILVIFSISPQYGQNIFSKPAVKYSQPKRPIF